VRFPSAPPSSASRRQSDWIGFLEPTGLAHIGDVIDNSRQLGHWQGINDEWNPMDRPRNRWRQLPERMIAAGLGALALLSVGKRR